IFFFFCKIGRVYLCSYNTTYDYNEVLHKSNLFYNAQRSGALSPRYNRILWRGDSCLKDGCSIGVDLSKGWFDAGDYIKFMFPMASTVTLLSWGGINYRQAYFDSGTLSRFISSIRWATSYLIAAHIAPQELVVQVGSGSSHRFWSRPEEITGARPIYKITPTKPGSDVAAETAAALAAASVFLRPTHAAMANDALAHARTIYSFAKQHRGLYHVSVPQAKRYYKSYSDEDEMIWGAAWLYRATGEQRYLNDATRQYLRASGPYLVEREFSWDRKMIGVQVLMANLTGEAMYRDRVADFMNNVMNVIPSTPQGLMWLRKWGPNRYAANAAMMAIMASQLQPPLTNSALYERWGRRQIHLLLGDSGRSYVVGFGRNYPQRPHHRSSSCPKPPAVCNHGSGLHSRRRNPFTLFGALVGGPDKRGNYLDRRTKYEQSEVGLDYNAGFQSAVAGLKQLVVERRPPRQSTTRSG
uniref:Endoglucanase n=1 Tax=Ciona intestinalis TaxID=7719 RepID=F6S7X2_CIOIN